MFENQIKTKRLGWKKYWRSSLEEGLVLDSVVGQLEFEGFAPGGKENLANCMADWEVRRIFVHAQLKIFLFQKTLLFLSFYSDFYCFTAA